MSTSPVFVPPFLSPPRLNPQRRPRRTSSAFPYAPTACSNPARIQVPVSLSDSPNPAVAARKSDHTSVSPQECKDVDVQKDTEFKEEDETNDESSAAPGSFAELYHDRLPQWLLLRLRELGYTHPVPVQQRALELALPPRAAPDGSVGSSTNPANALGRDVVIHAQTGSGKTLAYLLPAIAAVVPARASVQALIVVPTQELGMQVYKLLRRLTSRYRSAVEQTAAVGEINISDADIEIDIDVDFDVDVVTDGDVEDDDDGADRGSGESSVLEARTERMTFPVLPMLNQADLRRQKLQLREAAPRIIVGNPHRIAALVASGRLRLDLLKVLVVDEFDACLLDTSTTAALQAVLSVRHREGDRQTILASATVPQHRHFLRQCVRQHWTRPNITHVWLEDTDGPRVPPSLDHQYALVDSAKKLAALRTLLNLFNSRSKTLPSSSKGSGAEVAAMDEGESESAQSGLHAIVFVMPSRDVDSIVTALNTAIERDFGVPGQRPVVGLRDGLSIALRREALTRFRKREASVLIATDLAARGLDIPDISTVFHFDLPTDADSYLHRAGRAGRQGRAGTSVVLVSRGEEFVVRRISNKLGIDFGRVQRRSDDSSGD